MAINNHILILSESGVTSPVNSSDVVNEYYRGAIFFFNVTAFTNTSGNGLGFEIEAKDSTSGAYGPVAAQLSVSAPGLTILTVYPGVAPSFGGADQPTYLPDIFRVSVLQTAGDVASYTFSATLVS